MKLNVKCLRAGCETMIEIPTNGTTTILYCATHSARPPKPIVIIESPFAGDLERNARYLDACLLDSLRRGEAPFASHGLYTRPGVLRDADPAERELGIQAGFAFRRVASLTVVYTDLGISSGMQKGITDALRIGGTVEYRKLEGEWASKSCAGEKESHEVNGFCHHCADGWL